MTKEPILDEADVAAWQEWREVALVHARTRAHARRLDRAKKIIDEALGKVSPWVASWSGGKDSTVLTHLLCVEMGRAVDVFAHKDDLDFPESEPYILAHGAEWKLNLRICRPPVSPRQWMIDHARDASEGGLIDLHSRTSAIARAAWWDTIDQETASYAGYFDGLRAHESRARRLNRALRGNVYEKNHAVRGSIWVAHPIHDWLPEDVYGYCFARGIDLLPLYKCIGFMHRTEPWLIREEWWVPSADPAKRGEIAWLRRYYPSLYRQLESWVPETRALS